MLVATSRTTFEPASLAVLTHRYGAGAPAVVELIRGTGGCTSPIRLEGESVAVSGRLGTVLARRSTTSRRPQASSSSPAATDASRAVLPARSDIAATPTSWLRLGWRETRTGVSPSVASHPLVFATFTAPSFGAVHRRIVDAGGVRALPATLNRGNLRTRSLAALSRAPCRRTIPGSARRSVRTATTTRPRLYGTRTSEPCGAERSHTCPASSRP